MPCGLNWSQAVPSLSPVCLLFSSYNDRTAAVVQKSSGVFAFIPFILLCLSFSVSFFLLPTFCQSDLQLTKTHAGRVSSNNNPNTQTSPELHSRPQLTKMIPSMNSMPRRKGPPAALRLDTPVQNPQIALALGTTSATTSAASSAVSEDLFPFGPLTTKPLSLRNMKRLSLTLPLDSSTHSCSTPPSTESQSTSITTPDGSPVKLRPRRQSVASLFTTSINPMLHRKEEDGSPTVPYMDGPIQVIPGIWLGSEDNARDWKGLMERGIKTILNVAKEVTSPFDSAAAQPLRPFASTPNLYKNALELHKRANSTFYPAHLASGRPGMHYLKLEWSHGETDLVQTGFPSAMAFVDAALEREEGVLIQ
jgi:tyrosine-protein phosphatase MSG5